MRVERLQIEAAPGLPNGLPELELDSGITVIVGPNGSGKSTLVRVLRELLWPAAESSGAEARSHWLCAEKRHVAGLFAGKVTWEPPLSSPAPDGAAGLARFGVHSLLAADDKSDEALGRRIALDLAGGLDFSSAADRFQPSRKLQQALTARKSAQQSLRQAKNKTRELAEKEVSLASLKKQIASAECAGQHKASAERLLELARAHETLAELKDQVYAPGLELLEGNESDRIQALDRELVEQEAELSNLKKTREELAATTLENAFPQDPPERREFDAWTERLEELAQGESRLQDLRSRVAGVEQELSAHRARVGTAAPADAPRATMLDELGRGIAGVRTAQGELQAQQKVADVWQSWAEGADQDPDSLREATRDLRQWLRSPGADTPKSESSRPTGLAWALIGSGLVCLLIAVLSGQPWLAAGLLLSGIGATLLWNGPRRAGVTVENNARDAARQALSRGAHAPSSWEVGAVEEHLSELQRQLIKLEQAHSAAQQMNEARRALPLALEQLAKQTSALRDLATELGATLEFVDLGDLERVQVLIEWFRLSAKLAELTPRLEHLEEDRARQLGECASWLQSYGGVVPDDLSAARAALTELRNRREDLLKARKASRVAKDDYHKQNQARAAAAEELKVLWKRSAVQHGDLAALAQRLEERKSWATHQEQVRDARREVESRRVTWARAGELPQLKGDKPESVTCEQVLGWITALAADSEQFGDLTAEAGGIQRELELAATSHNLEDALALLVAAEQVVADEREHAIINSIASELLSEARTQHETDHAPPTLERAQERFACFTNEGWRLEIETDSGAFRAHDCGTGQSCSLAELSDGTRAQLLLAVRLAALEGLETAGEPLPVCLDEALSISDPVRFHAIASALFDLADDGRQILYFTADPTEAAQWLRVGEKLGRPQPRVLDLQALRGTPVDWGGELPALPPEPERVPDPADLAPAEYARRIDAPPPDGFLDVSAWHLYLTAHDDLEALATCLRHHLKTIGHWREACRREATPDGIPALVQERLSARADLAVALADTWRIGRGRPVTWEEVQAARAVSENFEQRVRPLLAEHARNPQQFVKSVGEIKSFHGAQVDKLRTHLELIGCIDNQTVLSSEDLVRRTLQSAPEATASLGTEPAAGFVQWLIELLGT